MSLDIHIWYIYNRLLMLYLYPYEAYGPMAHSWYILIYYSELSGPMLPWFKVPHVKLLNWSPWLSDLASANNPHEPLALFHVAWRWPRNLWALCLACGCSACGVWWIDDHCCGRMEPSPNGLMVESIYLYRLCKFLCGDRCENNSEKVQQRLFLDSSSALGLIRRSGTGRLKHI